MNLLEEIALRTRFSFRSVHGLPGRLRLRFAALRGLPERWAGLLPILERLLGARAGVKSVRIDRRTGSVLIHYDPGLITEADILGFLRTLAELLLRNRAQLGEIPVERAAAVAEKLADWLRPGGPNQSNQRMKIPDDVWT